MLQFPAFMRQFPSPPLISSSTMLPLLASSHNDELLLAMEESELEDRVVFSPFSPSSIGLVVPMGVFDHLTSLLYGRNYKSIPSRTHTKFCIDNCGDKPTKPAHSPVINMEKLKSLAGQTEFEETPPDHEEQRFMHDKEENLPRPRLYIRHAIRQGLREKFLMMRALLMSICTASSLSEQTGFKDFLGQYQGRRNY
ncbi:hypothetical protein KFK09_027036 [Dendrobium nobile]|uniref:Uncharacterized protein n=1 Tax=Dendrobium nobile TaxID=94219 RepID=A0A8T3A997_DENNO|nr:hypothetical protein KFK09_027036 [Dendrobium nobile]